MSAEGSPTREIPAGVTSRATTDDASVPSEQETPTNGSPLTGDLASILAHVPDGVVSVSWQAPDGTFRSTLTTVAGAHVEVAKHAGGHTWISCMSVDPNARGRGTAQELRRLNWLPIDFDVKEGSFPDVPSAVQAIQTLAEWIGHRPIVVVHTGHGLQPWWLTDPDDDAWRCTDHTDPRWADMLAAVRRWGRVAAKAAKQHNAPDVDNVADLARVMRAPGTTNVKDPNDPRKVFAVPSSDWSPIGFRELLDAMDALHDPELSEKGSDLADELTGRERSRPAPGRPGSSQTSVEQMSSSTRSNTRVRARLTPRRPSVDNLVTPLTGRYRFGRNRYGNYRRAGT